MNAGLYAPDAADRAHAFREIGLLDPTPELMKSCLQGLSDQDEDVRMEAIPALEMFENSSVIPWLERIAARDPSSQVREAALEALDSLRNP